VNPHPIVAQEGPFVTRRLDHDLYEATDGTRTVLFATLADALRWWATRKKEQCCE
jgi:hypothetical protein